MIFCRTSIVVATTILLLHTQTRRSIMDANVRNIEKRLDALERMQTMTMKPPIANVGTLGLWAFALTTAMLSVKELRVGASDDGAVGVTIGFAFGFGGLVQPLAGILSALRGQSFSAVAFANVAEAGSLFPEGSYKKGSVTMKVTADGEYRTSYVYNNTRYWKTGFALDEGFGVCSSDDTSGNLWVIDEDGVGNCYASSVRGNRLIIDKLDSNHSKRLGGIWVKQ